MNLPTRTWLLKRYSVSNDGELVYKGTTAPADAEKPGFISVLGRDILVSDILRVMETPSKPAKPRKKVRPMKKPRQVQGFPVRVLRRDVQANARVEKEWETSPPVERVESFKPESKTRAKPLPDSAHLNALFYYDPETGQIDWRSKAKISAGAPLKGNTRKPNSEGYVKIHAFGRVLFAHRIAWALHYGEDPGIMLVDHINGNRSDNRIANLRLVTHSGNLRNPNTPLRLGVSGVRGVSWDSRRQKWVAGLRVKRKRLHFGVFGTKGEAAAAVERYLTTGEGVKTRGGYLAKRRKTAA